jgi:hypothetical protein
VIAFVEPRFCGRQVQLLSRRPLDAEAVDCRHDPAIRPENDDRIVVPAIGTALEKRKSKNDAEFARQRGKFLDESSVHRLGALAPDGRIGEAEIRQSSKLGQQHEGDTRASGGSDGGRRTRLVLSQVTRSGAQLYRSDVHALS